MKKIALTLGTLATVASPLTTAISCSTNNGSLYFYELIIEPVDHERRSLELSIFHLPTEGEDSIGNDFREEYWRRVYGDLGKQLYDRRTTLVIDKMTIVYSSIDHSDQGGFETWELDFIDREQFPFDPYITVLEHIALPGEKIFVEDEDGNEILVEAEVETLVPEKIFYFQTLQHLFTDTIKEFVNKESLLITYPKSESVPSARWDEYGFLIRRLFQQHLKQI